MKGLILKDIYYTLHDFKKTLLFLSIVTVFYSIFLHRATDGDAISAFILTAVPAFTAICMSISTFAHDEKTEWMKFSLTTPLNRRQYLWSKYLSHLIFSTFGFLSGILLILLTEWITGTMGFDQAVAIAVASMIAILFFSTLLIPLLIRFGIMKGILTSILLFFGLLIFGTIYMFLLIYKLMGSERISTFVFILIPGAFLIAFFVIHLYGIKWMMEKEF